MEHHDVVVVGAGHAGAQVAIALRQRKFGGTIALVGAEPYLPYERPALSKEYLAGEKAFERLLIRPAEFWRERNVRMLLGRTVVSVDAAGHRLFLSSGDILSYDTLVWAAGGRPRRLACPGAELARVHYLRARADVDKMLSQMDEAGKLVIIGGGYIGLEAAAVLAGLGKKVVLLEAMDRVLTRVACEPVSRFFEAEHRARGVDLRTGASVECIEGKNGAANGVRLSDGTLIAADMVLVGIGITPAVEPLLAAGACGTNGVDVDEFCSTSLPGVYAVGDCAAHLNRFAGGARVRIESVQNANDQATTAAKAIAGAPEPYAAIPWFWSTQYGLKLQTVGLLHGYDEVIVRGSPGSGTFSIVYLKQGTIIALDCINAMKDFVQGRKLVAGQAVADRGKLSNPDVQLKELI